MARTENEKTRDDQIINLLRNIWNELRELRKNMESKDASK